MVMKIDITRQTFLIYCGVAVSACLGLLSGFMLIVHIPLLSRNYQFAVYLELDVYKTIYSCLLCISFDCFLSAASSFFLYGAFINVKVRRSFWRFLRILYLINCMFILLNVGCVLVMIDSLGTLRTDVQYKLYAKMKLYADNNTEYQPNDVNKHKELIDKMQQNYKCCGVTGPTDWFNIKWLPLLEIEDMEDFKYLNQHGLVALAPLSCCDRRKTFICPRKDRNALVRYYSEGCRHQITELIMHKVLTTEVVLSVILLVIQILVTVFFTVISSSMKSMFSGMYGENVGIASFSSWIPTRHLELQSRGTPLLMQSTNENLPLQMKRVRNIETKKKIGRVIDGTAYLRPIKEIYPTTAVQSFLRTYFPIIERAVFDNDPPFMVIFFRFFAKASIGFLIAELFLTAFATAIEGQTKVSDTLVDLVIYSTYISFTFAFVKSTKFRAVAILLIPNLGMKTGRAFLMAELARITAVGPLACIAGNVQAVMITLHCSMGLAINITRDIQKITINPMRKLILKTIEASDSLKKSTLDVYNASRPVTEDIDDSEARSKRIRAAMESGKSTREINLKNKFTKLLHKLDRTEQRKFQQKTQKLRDQYMKLEQQFRQTMVNIEKYKDVFSNKSSQIVSQMRTKMFSGCSSVAQVKSQICQKTIGLACGKMQQLITGNLNLGFSIKEMCYDEIESDSSCNVQKALESSKKCANEQEAANAKDGFGGVHQGTKDGLSAMQEIFDFNVSWKFERKSFNVDGDTVLHGTALFTFTLSDGVLVLVDIIILFFVILKILLMLVIFRSFSYCKKYLTDLDYDNKYITKYFEQIDKQRKLINRSSLLPLKSYELKIVLYKKIFYTSEEIGKVVKDLIKILAIFISLGITFLVAEVFFTALEVVRDVCLIELTIKSDEMLNITTTGDGIIKQLMDIMLEEVKNLGAFNVTYSLTDCAPDIKPVSGHHKRLFIITSLIILALTISNGYLVRSRHVICSYFYPKRERQRIVHLYNTLLLGRKRYMRSKKNIILYKVKQNRLEVEYSFILSLRRDYPFFFNWLKIFSKYRCLICNDAENEDFFICEEDFSPFCKDCFEDINKTCLVCYMMTLNANEDNVNNYYEAQNLYSQPSDCSTSGNENSDVEHSKEVVGWLSHPLDVLREDVSIYKSVINELNSK